MMNVTCRRIRMNFCWVIASLRRSTTSPIVNLRSLRRLEGDAPVGLTVRMGVSPLSLENQSRTSSQLADVKLTVTVFSGAAGAPVGGVPGGGAGTTAPGMPGAGIGFGWPGVCATAQLGGAGHADGRGEHAGQPLPELPARESHPTGAVTQEHGRPPKLRAFVAARSSGRVHCGRLSRPPVPPRAAAVPTKVVTYVSGEYRRVAGVGNRKPPSVGLFNQPSTPVYRIRRLKWVVRLE